MLFKYIKKKERIKSVLIEKGKWKNSINIKFPLFSISKPSLNNNWSIDLFESEINNIKDIDIRVEHSLGNIYCCYFSYVYDKDFDIKEASILLSYKINDKKEPGLISEKEIKISRIKKFEVITYNSFIYDIIKFSTNNKAKILDLIENNKDKLTYVSLNLSIVIKEKCLDVFKKKASIIKEKNKDLTQSENPLDLILRLYPISLFNRAILIENSLYLKNNILFKKTRNLALNLILRKKIEKYKKIHSFLK